MATAAATVPDEQVDYVVVGAGISGLGFANAIRARDPGATVLVLEGDAEPGGYCKTVERDGFTWDYSGHFFHFRRPEIEAWLRARMPGVEVRTVHKRATVRYRGLDVDFPFQKNIHQLDKPDFIDCLVDLYFAAEARGGAAPRTFKEMLIGRLGRNIAERFLIPYNEKLYACDLDELDVDAMGRFFPHVDVADVVRNMRAADNASYNSTFSYPRGGAIRYVRALLHDLPAGAVALGEPVVGVDVAAKIARTPRRAIRYRRLVSSAPLPALLALCGRPAEEGLYSWNKVLVFNLGFDGKGPRDVHWTYFPDRTLTFYRVGFYDNIHGEPRMSLYVEIGARAGQALDVEMTRARVLADLRREGIVTTQRLVAWHSVVLDPAYVHVTRASLAAAAAARAELAAAGVHSIGRYGGWTYCSIEDNLVEARALAEAI